jgi:hypothetical protein
LKKRTKKLFPALRDAGFGPRAPMDESFLVLFFKKEPLPFGGRVDHRRCAASDDGLRGEEGPRAEIGFANGVDDQTMRGNGASVGKISV